MRAVAAVALVSLFTTACPKEEPQKRFTSSARAVLVGGIALLTVAGTGADCDMNKMAGQVSTMNCRGHEAINDRTRPRICSAWSSSSRRCRPRTMTPIRCRRRSPLHRPRHPRQADARTQRNLNRRGLAADLPTFALADSRAVEHLMAGPRGCRRCPRCRGSTPCDRRTGRAGCRRSAADVLGLHATVVDEATPWRAARHQPPGEQRHVEQRAELRPWDRPATVRNGWAAWCRRSPRFSVTLKHGECAQLQWPQMLSTRPSCSFPVLELELAGELLGDVRDRLTVLRLEQGDVGNRTSASTSRIVVAFLRRRRRGCRCSPPSWRRVGLQDDLLFADHVVEVMLNSPIGALASSGPFASRGAISLVEDLGITLASAADEVPEVGAALTPSPRRSRPSIAGVTSPIVPTSRAGRQGSRRPPRKFA